VQSQSNEESVDMAGIILRGTVSGSEVEAFLAVRLLESQDEFVQAGYGFKE
jgi:hypothetical protein